MKAVSMCETKYIYVLGGVSWVLECKDVQKPRSISEAWQISRPTCTGANTLGEFVIEFQLTLILVIQ